MAMRRKQTALTTAGILSVAALAAIAVASSIVPGMNIMQTAYAAQPNNQACLGSDFSGYAQGGSVFGAFIQLLALFTGLGEEVQAHLAGFVPDTVIPNSCND